MSGYADKSVSTLLAMFERVCLDQDETYILDGVKKYNKLYKTKRLIVKEFASRPGDERRALLPFLHHENPHVRLQAAKAAYSVAPAECRACLEAIQAAKLPDQSLDAGMTLRQLSIDPHCLDRT